MWRSSPSPFLCSNTSRISRLLVRLLSDERLSSCVSMMTSEQIPRNFLGNVVKARGKIYVGGCPGLIVMEEIVFNQKHDLRTCCYWSDTLVNEVKAMKGSSCQSSVCVKASKATTWPHFFFFFFFFLLVVAPATPSVQSARGIALTVPVPPSRGVEFG